MRKFLATAALAAALSIPSFAAANDLTEAVAADYDYVLDLYKHFHANPELSFKEKDTSARLAKELKSLGFKVTERFGDDWVKKKVLKDEGQLRRRGRDEKWRRPNGHVACGYGRIAARGKNRPPL